MMRPDSQIETRTLPHTDLTVSRACYGAMTFGKQTGRALSTRLVDQRIDAGINSCDTAQTILENATKGSGIGGARQQRGVQGGRRAEGYRRLTRRDPAGDQPEPGAVAGTDRGIAGSHG